MQIIQAHLLIHLQLVDDVLDAQDQIGPGDAALPLDGAVIRLPRLFGPGHIFWASWRALLDQQAASARWELEGRTGPLPAFNDALVEALAAKGAILRWPAAAMALLEPKPAMVSPLAEISVGVLAFMLMLNDLADFEGDAARGQINAVLCAAAARSREPLDFYARTPRFRFLE